MEKIRSNAAGIDIGSQQIFVAVEQGKVRHFETFTIGLYQARDYLLEEGIQTVAMEATGVYWIILYEILESAGLDVWLVDGKQTRQVPGRKTDVKDCQWIQQLHSYGLLNRCFIPDDLVKEVRCYTRLREDHIRSAAMHVNHMQKALTEMNLRLKQVLSQVHGASGMAMIEAILAGERDPHELLALCHTSVKKTKANEILKSLEGHYSTQGLFALQQAYEGYQFFQKQIACCDRQLEELLQNTHKAGNTSEAPKRKPIRHNKPQVTNLGGHLLRFFNNSDATLLPSITDYSWLQLYAEVEADLSQWKSEKHFTSWLGLAPGHNQSGKGKRKSKSRGRPKAGQIFRNAAQSLIESKNIALGAFGRRIKAKRGPAVAIKAVARKLALLYYRLMVKGLEYTELGITKYQDQLQQQKQNWLLKTANSMGYNLTLVATS